MSHKLPSTKLLGTSITTATKEEILEYIFKMMEKGTEKGYIVTPNPEILVYASRSSEFQKILNGATLSLPDGIGVLLADRIHKNRLQGRITGVDMLDLLCSQSSKRAFTVGFLGGSRGVAELTAECLREKYPNLIVNFAGEEWPSGKMVNGQWLIDKNNSKGKSLPLNINHQSLIIKHIDILFVAFGVPKQEEWIAKNLSNIPVTVAMGVGGAFDYISGKVPRAPQLVRKVGMEWAFRLLVQPWRIKRQLALPVFIGKILKEKFDIRK